MKWFADKKIILERNLLMRNINEAWKTANSFMAENNQIYEQVLDYASEHNLEIPDYIQSLEEERFEAYKKLQNSFYTLLRTDLDVLKNKLEFRINIPYDSDFNYDHNSNIYYALEPSKHQHLPKVEQLEQVRSKEGALKTDGNYKVCQLVVDNREELEVYMDVFKEMLESDDLSPFREALNYIEETYSLVKRFNKQLEDLLIMWKDLGSLDEIDEKIEKYQNLRFQV